MVDDESPRPPMMPSFASLRDPRRRTAVDVLLPAAPRRGRRPVPSPLAAARGRRSTPTCGASGVHVARSLAVMPLRVAGWAVREPALPAAACSAR